MMINTVLALVLLTQVQAVDFPIAHEQAVIRVFAGNAMGSGVVVHASDNDAWILTAYHVTNGRRQVDIRWPERATLQATFVRGNEERDVALYYISRPPPSKVYASVCERKLEVGEEVTYCGYSSGWLHRFTARITRIDKNWVYTTRGVIPGDSGGAIFNKDGELIGIVYGATLDEFRRHIDAHGPNNEVLLSFIWPSYYSF